jgi:hypothetical protein
MSAALQPPTTATEADRQAEGWRLGRLAARFALRSLEGEVAKPADRQVLATAIQRIDAIEVPACIVVLPRAERLATAIRTALALSEAALSEEAVVILKDALK